MGFFEEFDELVYLADIRSHELLYMNRALRDSLGYRSHTEYRGRKCYEVLQGESSSCTFCTSQKLVERGHVLSWVHSNPILKKRYLIKDSQVEYEGRPCRLEIAIDMDAQAVGKTPYCYSSRETVLNE